MKRYAHYWWPLKGTRYPSRIAVLDCDSAPCSGIGASGVQREQLAAWVLASATLRAGSVVSVSRRSGDSVSSLWSAIGQLLASKDRTWLICPGAGAVLPLIDFWRRLEDGELSLSGHDRREGDRAGNGDSDQQEGVCIVEDPPTVILCHARNRPGKMLMLDVQNWGVEVLGQEVSISERVEYYHSGILSCMHALREHRQGALRCTAGSQAVSALRQDRQCVQLHCHVSAPVLALERAAYFGGRCECFRLGVISGDTYHVDVRNMYPSLCLTQPVPVSLRRYHDSGSGATDCVRQRAASCIAHVRIRTERARWPLRRRDDTIYPVGEYDAYLCGPELSAAVSSGAVVRVYAAAEYTCRPALSVFFRQWLSMLTEARARGNTLLQGYIKRVMNALIGKFGEPGRCWVSAGRRTEMGPYGTWFESDRSGAVVRHRNIAWNTQREEINGESYWSIPAIAAWVTSAGRCQLWNYYQTAGGENVWYVDTDSLLTNGVGFDRLLSSGVIRDGEAGYLRVIGSDKRCAIYGIRHYQFGDSICCAGVPRGLIRPGETRGQYWIRQSAKTEITVGLRPEPEWERGYYPEYDDYRHGRVMPDGRVIPWEI